MGDRLRPWSPFPGDRVLPSWAEHLNRFFQGRFEVVTILDCDPVPCPVGAYTPPHDLVPAVEAERAILSAPGRYNETQAVVASAVDLGAAPIRLPYRTIDYATVRARLARG